jgi:outer membrane protein assembly factor BamB
MQRNSKIACGIVALILFSAVGAAQAQQSVLTYHYDNQRTGWNPNETILTPANVPSLQLLASVPLDDQVDAQPLVYNGVVYVVTESNTVYAIDAVNGNILSTNNFGPSFGSCVAGNVGINSTPVIDPGSSTLYIMVYTSDGNGNPIYQLHALDLGSLSDKVAPATVSASSTLVDRI